MKYNRTPDRWKAFKMLKLSFVVQMILGSSLLVSAPAFAAPQGGVVTSGTAAIGRAGAITNINQSTNKASINWQSFSTKPAETVNFRQPSVSSITLNRVIGNEKSVLEGALNANGKVFLINSNGVLFTKGSTVNTAGLVASTLNLSDEDFNAGKYVFKANSSTGSVINLGTISVRDGGSVALLGNTVSNQGVITATKGTVALSSGDRVTLNFNGDSLVSVTIDEGALNALVENKQAIYADGGTVIMTARAADDLLSAQVNNSGIVQARTIDDLKGSINLHAYGGTITVDGAIDASAPTSGDGGTIETSGDHVKIADSAFISTKSAHGTTGSWLIDPDGFTIGVGGDITGTLLGSLLGNSNITLSSTSGSGTDGDINVNQAVSWSADTILTLTATNGININKSITATGTNAGLALNYGGNYHILTPASYSGAILDANGTPVANSAPVGTEYASITLSGSNASLAMNGNSYTLIHSMADLDLLDGRNSVTGIGTATMLSGYYALAQNLDASGSTYTGAPIGTFSGTLAGLGHKISNMTISATSNQVGLIGTTTGTTTVRDIGLERVAVSTTGYNGVGALLGTSSATALTVSQAYSTGTVTGLAGVGGLVGSADSGTTTISDSYSEANISATRNNVGGLIGNARNAVITNSHATGDINVTGGTAASPRSYIGGLAGNSINTTVSNSFATGNVSSGYSFGAGGLIGYVNQTNASASISVSNSFATGNVIGGYYIGGLIGKASASSTYPVAVDNTYASGNITGTLATSGSSEGGGIGGLIGWAGYVNISNSDATGDIISAISNTTASSYRLSNLGGLVGYMKSGSVTGSHATGNVIGQGGSFNSNMGGLVGYSTATIESSYATGDVTNGFSNVGGLVGSSNANITNSWASGLVSGNTVVGGLVGMESGGTITGCTATGNVTGIDRTLNSTIIASSQVGGLAGNLNGGDIVDSTATGDVTGGDKVGGLVGKFVNGSSISGSIASGKVTGATDSVGGLVGYSEGNQYSTSSITNSYWDMGRSGQNNAVGVSMYSPDDISLVRGTTNSTISNVKGLTSEQFKDVQYYHDGTIDQVLADRAVVAAYHTAAGNQAGSTMGRAQQEQTEQTALSTRIVEQQQPSIDGHIVYADSADYSADIKAINADGVEFDLEDDSHDKKK